MRLIILSDIFGSEDIGWVDTYLDKLSTQFDVQFYDSCALADIDTSFYNQEEVHQQFVDGGINRAVQNLLGKEQNEVAVLGFSIGGLIAWKACLAGLNSKYLCCTSSTRLRYETQKPAAKTDLYFCRERSL